MSSSTLKIVGLFLVFVVIIVLSTFGLLKEVSPTGGMTKEEVENIVRDYITTNPELIIKSLTEFQQNAQSKQEVESQKSISSKKDELENDPSSPVAGNPKGDVTIVEFFDYSCGYCKKVYPTVSTLIKEDSNLKVVFKELPILGPNSTLASQAAIAVHQLAPEKYFDFHAALMKEHISGKDSLLKIATGLGLKADDVAKKMESAEVNSVLEKNHKLAGEIGIRGTPAFIINGDFIPGAIDAGEFKSRIKTAREKK